MSIIEKIRQNADQDLKFDSADLDGEALRIPQLHNKYMNLLADAKMNLRNARNEYDVLLREKWEYYTGKMDAETLARKGWAPFQLRVLKSDLDIYMNSDTDLIHQKNKIEMREQVRDFLESVVKGIMNRHWQIRSAIDFLKFKHGIN
jgi:hypothetical protein